MKKLFAIFALISLFFSGHAMADNATKEQAVDLVKQAAAVVKAGNQEKLIKDVNAKSSDWYKGELYLIVLDMNGNHLAHPTNNKLLGKAMLDAPDVSGKMFRQERVDIAKNKGEGWVDYKYKNPETGKVEDKTLYVLRSGDLILSAGIYK